MADEALRQVKHGKEGVKPEKQNVKPAVAPELKKAEVKSEERQEQKKEDVKKETGEDKKGVKAEVKTGDSKITDDKKEGKKPVVKAAPKKHESKVYGRSLPISQKYAVAIGKFIKNKKIGSAISDLEMVMIKKKVVPMRGELAHKKGKGISSGKYPVKASENFIKMLKSLSANSAQHGMDLDKTKISVVVANKAPEQVHRYGRTKFKRTHVSIVAKDGGK